MDTADVREDRPVEPALAQAIIDNATQYAIFTLDARGRITSWSPGAERILGYSTEEAVGMDFGVLFLEADRSADTPGQELEKALRDGCAEDTRWHVRRNGDIFWANGMTMRIGDSPSLVKVMRDETQTKLAEDQRVLLLNELNHRIKNTLATVQSIVDQTLRASDLDGSVRQTLTERLVALSEAHNVLVDESWAGADLMTVAGRALAPHRQDGRDRFELDGPPTRLSPQQAVSMALVLHELTTNALKYGALSVPTGKVAITWNLAYDERGGRNLTLLWRESGGPAVAAPTRRGFGTRLISRSFGQTAGGRARLDYAADGVRCVLELPLSGPDETAILEIRGDPAGANGASAGSPAS